MFAGLRQHHPLYILEKGDELILKQGQVVGISNLTPKYSTIPNMSPTATVDVTVRVDGEILDFKALPSNLSIANFGPSNMVISDNTEDMIMAIKALKQLSADILDNVPYHTSVVEKCEQYLQELDPTIAKEKEQEGKLTLLEGRINGMENTLMDVKEMLSTFLQTPKTE